MLVRHDYEKCADIDIFGVLCLTNAHISHIGDFLGSISGRVCVTLKGCNSAPREQIIPKFFKKTRLASIYNKKSMKNWCEICLCIHFHLLIAR